MVVVSTEGVNMCGFPWPEEVLGRYMLSSQISAAFRSLVLVVGEGVLSPTESGASLSLDPCATTPLYSHPDT